MTKFLAQAKAEKVDKYIWKQLTKLEIPRSLIGSVLDKVDKGKAKELKVERVTVAKQAVANPTTAKPTVETAGKQTPPVRQPKSILKAQKAPAPARPPRSPDVDIFTCGACDEQFCPKEDLLEHLARKKGDHNHRMRGRTFNVDPQHGLVPVKRRRVKFDDY
jgi:hypothetical protein